MSSPEWGIKRVCPSCNIKYYDFNKNPIVCPKCHSEFDPDLLLKSRKGRGIATKVEDVNPSNNAEKENETIEEDINTLENDEEILEMEDDQSEIEETNIDVVVEDNIDDNEIDIAEDEVNPKEEDFSIEIEDNNSENEEK